MCFFFLFYLSTYVDFTPKKNYYFNNLNFYYPQCSKKTTDKKRETQKQQQEIEEETDYSKSDRLCSCIRFRTGTFSS